MKPEIKTAWLDLLTSGAYLPSSNGYLCTRTDTGKVYTSMGVLCELAITCGVSVVKEAVVADGYYITTYGGESFILPYEIAYWAEMERLPWLRIAQPSGIHNLAYLNKLGGGSFELEAAAIKEHL